MILYLNTANSGYIVLGLVSRGASWRLKKIKAKYLHSERLLVNIEKLLGKNLNKLKGVIVIKGPGSFTALRIGITTANTLAWALHLPIVGQALVGQGDDKALVEKSIKKLEKIKKFKCILPRYGQEPNITVKK